ncbi:MAG: hypothetical protein SGJ20_08485 [Planctomycetota bacterium]|nr:hypothetical protein [Planctomycetota bacterium]
MQLGKKSVAVLAVLLFLAGAAAGFVYNAQRLPNPNEADLNQLVRWLVTKDLRQESPQTKDELLDGLEQQIQTPIRSADVQSQLTAPQQTLLMSNADVLAERWFHRQVDQYFAQPEATRPAYLDKQIDEIQGSQLVQSLAGLAENETASGDTKAGNKSAIWIAIQQRAKSWIERAEKYRRRRCQQFVDAVQQHLLMRWLQDSAPAAKSD